MGPRPTIVVSRSTASLVAPTALLGQLPPQQQQQQLQRQLADRNATGEHLANPVVATSEAAAADRDSVTSAVMVTGPKMQPPNRSFSSSRAPDATVTQHSEGHSPSNIATRGRGRSRRGRNARLGHSSTANGYHSSSVFNGDPPLPSASNRSSASRDRATVVSYTQQQQPRQQLMRTQASAVATAQGDGDGSNGGRTGLKSQAASPASSTSAPAPASHGPIPFPFSPQPQQQQQQQQQQLLQLLAGDFSSGGANSSSSEGPHSAAPQLQMQMPPFVYGCSTVASPSSASASSFSSPLSAAARNGFYVNHGAEELYGSSAAGGEVNGGSDAEEVLQQRQQVFAAQQQAMYQLQASASYAAHVNSGSGSGPYFLVVQQPPSQLHDLQPAPAMAYAAASGSGMDLHSMGYSGMVGVPLEFSHQPPYAHGRNYYQQMQQQLRYPPSIYSHQPPLPPYPPPHPAPAGTNAHQASPVFADVSRPAQAVGLPAAATAGNTNVQRSLSTAQAGFSHSPAPSVPRLRLGQS